MDNDEEFLGAETGYGHDDLFMNSIVALGSNQLVLNHPEVRGIRVRRNPAGTGALIDLYVYTASNSLKFLVKEEFGGNEVCFHNAELWPGISAVNV